MIFFHSPIPQPQKICFDLCYQKSLHKSWPVLSLSAAITQTARWRGGVSCGRRRGNGGDDDRKWRRRRRVLEKGGQGGFHLFKGTLKIRCSNNCFLNKQLLRLCQPINRLRLQSYWNSRLRSTILINYTIYGLLWQKLVAIARNRLMRVSSEFDRRAPFAAEGGLLPRALRRPAVGHHSDSPNTVSVNIHEGNITVLGG